MNDLYGDVLEHHGTKGQKWGVWNEETRARYLGIKTGLKNRVSKTAKNLSDAHKVKSEQRKAEKAEASRIKKEERVAAKAAKEEQERFDKETRKKYHLSADQYKKLRETTLNSNDPNVVEKGMHLLNDKELNEKIERLRKENEIRNLSSLKTKRENDERKARAEAREKSLGYVIAKNASDKALNIVADQVLKPGAQEMMRRARANFDDERKKAGERNQQQMKKNEKDLEKQLAKREKQEKQAAEKQAKKEREAAERKEKKEQQAAERKAKAEEQMRLKAERDEAAYQERKKQAAADTERLIEMMKRQEHEAEVLSNRDHYRDPEYYRLKRKQRI